MSILDESDCNLVWYLYMVPGGEWPKMKRFRSCCEESEIIPSDMIGCIEVSYQYYRMIMLVQCPNDVLSYMAKCGASTQYINGSGSQWWVWHGKFLINFYRVKMTTAGSGVIDESMVSLPIISLSWRLIFGGMSILWYYYWMDRIVTIHVRVTTF